MINPVQPMMVFDTENYYGNSQSENLWGGFNLSKQGLSSQMSLFPIEPPYTTTFDILRDSRNPIMQNSVITESVGTRQSFDFSIIYTGGNFGILVYGTDVDYALNFAYLYWDADENKFMGQSHNGPLAVNYSAVNLDQVQGYNHYFGQFSHAGYISLYKGRKPAFHYVFASLGAFEEPRNYMILPGVNTGNHLNHVMMDSRRAVSIASAKFPKPTVKPYMLNNSDYTSGRYDDTGYRRYELPFYKYPRFTLPFTYNEQLPYKPALMMIDNRAGIADIKASVNTYEWYVNAGDIWQGPALKKTDITLGCTLASKANLVILERPINDYYKTF